MYVQFCVKGILSNLSTSTSNYFDWNSAKDVLVTESGIVSNWWRNEGGIESFEIAGQLNEHNLDRHLHDYENFGSNSPFISLASGCVERDYLLMNNKVYSAVDTALGFATDFWKAPGALFYCWVPVSLNPAVELQSVAEAVRDLHVYHRWSRYQLEGEITAKIHVPSNQISKVEWWDGKYSRNGPQHTYFNQKYSDPAAITNLRDFF